MRRWFFAFLLTGSLFLVRPVQAQIQAQAQAQPLAPAKTPLLPATYAYTAYTVYDRSSPDPATPVANVGGTLTLRPDSTYDKRLSIVFPSGLRFFTQTGRYRVSGDSIQFIFRDLRGPDVQRGTYRLEPGTRRLTITIAGYPPGNQGVYELLAQPDTPPPLAAPAEAQTEARTEIRAEILPKTRPKKPVRTRPRRPRR